MTPEQLQEIEAHSQGENDITAWMYDPSQADQDIDPVELSAILEVK